MGGETPIEGHLLVVWGVPEPKEEIAKLRLQHPNLKVTYKQAKVAFADPLTIARHSEEEVSDDEWLSATYIATMSYLPPPRLVPSIIKNLKFVQLTSAGVNHLAMHPLFTSTSLPIATTSGIHGPPISEWVALQILSDSHLQRTMYKWQSERNWVKAAGVSTYGFRDGVGRRVGILGYGSIGRQTARVLSAMGMDIVAYTASPRTTPESKRDTGFIVPGTLGDREGSIPIAWHSGTDKASLHSFLGADLDYVVLALPLTGSTKQILGAEEFEILGRSGAYVLNISRGESIDQDALIAALKKPLGEGGLRGAALDVATPEPLPESSELWDLENVTITPHVSAWNGRYLERTLGVLNENLEREAKGEGLVNAVDRERGY
ncbi:hypothetical protein V493_03137 [Pseudogymnoascus sp. VKM F-4281 (FW-2241)]|nr:hypothetical protein V493_03137 [Pseudogymnoascus sp. VKM F-4281 (FW-2241)]